MQPPPPRAAIYARISQDRAGAGLGVERQVADCRALAERLGWEVVVVHSDNDLSAYSGKPRPGYRALLDDVRGRRIDGMLAWHTDRLHRSPVELEEFIAVCQDVPTHTVQAGHLDLSTPSGRMVARQLGAVARFESEHKGERVRAARQQAAAEGRWQGGARPFGFEADGQTIRPSEAAEIVAATDLVLAGAGLRSIVTDWNSRGIVTTFKAQRWASVSVRDVLTRPRNAGLAVYRGKVIGPAAWPAIVPEEKWRALVAVLTDPARRTNTGDSRVKWLGSGIYLCGVCERAELRVSVSGAKARAYRCRARDYEPGSSGHVTRTAAPLDSYIERIAIERLSRPDLVDYLRPTSSGIDTAPLHAEATTLRGRLDQLAEAFAEGGLTMTQLRTATDRMQGRLGEIEAELSRAVAVDPLAGIVGVPDVAEAWAGFDLRRRRAILETLMTVTVLPWNGKRAADGSRFNPDSVRVERNAPPA